MGPDIRQAARGLLRRPLFTAVVIVTLMLGVGATTAIFSAFYHTIVRPMPFADGGRLAYVWMQMKGGRGGMMISPERKLIDAYRASTTIEAIETYSHAEYSLASSGEPEVVSGGRIAGTLPAMLGVEPLLGRVFTPSELVAGGGNVVVLGESLWKGRFGGSRDAIGKQLEMTDGKRYEVIGVLPDYFAAFAGFDGNGQIWLPFVPSPDDHRSNVILKMRGGVTREMVAADFTRIGANVSAEHAIEGEWVPQLFGPEMFLDDTVKQGLPLLLAAIGAVLLIACANIAGLLLLRLTGRRREIAVRVALGAPRRAIARLIASEALLLAIVGSGLGVFFAVWLTSLVRELRPDSLSSLDAIRMDATTLWFAIAVGLLTAVLFGIAPVVFATRGDPTRTLMMGGGAGARMSGSTRMRSILVSGQIAVSLVLLVAAMLLVRSVAHLRGRDLGFEPDNVMTMRIPLPASRYADASARRAFFEQLEPLIRRIPGVANVSVSTGIPMQSGMMAGSLQIRDRELRENEKMSSGAFTMAGPEYMAAFRIPIIEGRYFGAGESDNSVVINETWAKQLWPVGSAVGRQMRFGNGPDADWQTVIGVVGDVVTFGPAGATDRPIMYSPNRYEWSDYVVIRTNADIPRLADQVRDAAVSIDSAVFPRDVASMNALLLKSLALDRFFMTLLISFASLAVLLSLVGLYGVIGSAVAARTHEIGIRLALGATPGNVQALVLRHGLTLVLAGLAIGLVGAYNAVKLLASSLHGVDARDPLAFAVAITLLAGGALGATFIPARRAVSVDPLAALRAE